MTRTTATVMVAVCLMLGIAEGHIRGPLYGPHYVPDAPRVAPAEVGSYDAIHTVAVLSGAGLQLELEERGAGSTKKNVLDIAAWQLDDRIEATVRNALKSRFRFVAVGYDRTSLARLRAGRAHVDQYNTFLGGLPANGADAFLVVRPNTTGGIALQTAANGNTILWVDFEIDVVDAHSLKVIARSTARVQPPGADHPNFPGLIVDKKFALDRSLTLSAERREELRVLTDEMLKVTVSETLRSLKLPAAAGG
jgi:hypothetical protein